MWYLWLIAAGIFLIIEMATTGFLIFWLAISSIFAMIASFITDNVFIQTAVFVITSSILIPFTKTFLTKFVDKEKVTPTNVSRVIGKTGIVISDINPLEATGQVKVCGEVWSAKADTNIPKDTEVEVLEIDGVKLIVEPKIKSLSDV